MTNRLTTGQALTKLRAAGIEMTRQNLTRQIVPHWEAAGLAEKDPMFNRWVVDERAIDILIDLHRQGNIGWYRKVDWTASLSDSDKAVT